MYNSTVLDTSSRESWARHCLLAVDPPRSSKPRDLAQHKGEFPVLLLKQRDRFGSCPTSSCRPESVSPAPHPMPSSKPLMTQRPDCIRKLETQKLGRSCSLVRQGSAELCQRMCAMRCTGCIFVGSGLRTRNRTRLQNQHICFYWYSRAGGRRDGLPRVGSSSGERW